MTNRELAKIFRDISKYLRMEDVSFKPRAYQRAALALEGMKKDVENIYKEGGLRALKDISGVGESIAEKIEEYIKTGRIKYYEKFKKKLPLNLGELTSVEGMGPRKARTLYRELGISDLKSLEKAAKQGKIRGLEGFGEKTEQNILQGIEFVKKNRGRFLLGDIMPIAREIIGKLEKLDEIKKIDVAGSVRRKKETIGDVDILAVSSEPEKVMDFFSSLDEVARIQSKGTTKGSVRTREGVGVDLRIVPEKSYGSALQYFTGSKEHNIATRKIAAGKGLKLNEYGVFRKDKQIAGRTEKEVYRAINLPLFPPEIRKDGGEIEAAQKEKLPNLIGYKDIKGDLHCHSDWDGGVNSIKEIAQKGKDMGYEYVGIADHTKFLKIEHGLDEKQLRKRNKEIDKINKEMEGVKVLKGCEANILKDGSVDIKDESLAELDFVIAGIHSRFKMGREEMTERIIKAMENPNIDIISHPTGRLIQKRDAYEIDFGKILKVARETRTILEINSFPERLDLKDDHIRKAKDSGVKMIINTDVHQKEQMRFMVLGIAQARRGWAEKKDIVNTKSLDKFLKSLK